MPGGDYEFLHFIWEHLVTYSVVPTTVSKNPFSGQYGPLVPELADSWNVSDDQKTWTFKLHPGVKWSDGTDFTSADVKFSFELCLNPKVGPCYPGGSMASIVGAEDVTKGTTPTLRGQGARSADGHASSTDAELAAAVQRHGPVHRPEVVLAAIDPARRSEKNDYFGARPARPSAPARSR